MNPPNSLRIVRTPAEMRTLSHGWQSAGERIALVPTMGNLHEGHFSLVKAAMAQADRVVVSIFVNPLQFGRGEDFDHYPRTLEADVLALTLLGVDAVFAPQVSDIYPQQTMADESASGTVILPPAHLTNLLCGASRPGHFTGVATIVGKLFHMVAPQLAFFGQKDYQQVCVLQQMVEDLNWPVRLEVCPTSRAEDGLALSSRNQYLNERERAIAPRLYQTLLRVADELREGSRQYGLLQRQASDSLLASGFDSVDYIDIRHPHNLQPAEQGDSQWVVLAAARLGKTRLIDNILVEGQPALT